ncbi:MAG: type IV pilin N-terminal domain-containing protein [Methanoregula sp.]|nr:type IV pilin N-terminal domain-containing protein [Methanoregula sp.]
MQKQKQSENAVSPVVGVMLMLVVTIIIAAVVSAFAGGLAGTQQSAPKASIDVQIKIDADDTMSGTNDVMTFTELSGDSIQTKDLAVITYYVNKSGTVYKNKQTLTSAGTQLYSYSTKLSRVPYLSDMRLGYASGNTVTDFGNYTWKTGDILSTGTTAGTADLLAINDTATPHGITDLADFESGSVVDVKILHVPSGQYIFNKEVIVQ